MDCVTGSPMADTQVRQVVPGRWGGEAVATEYVRSSRLFFTRRSVVISYQSQSSVSAGRGGAGGLSNGASPLRCDVVVSMATSSEVMRLALA